MDTNLTVSTIEAQLSSLYKQIMHLEAARAAAEAKAREEERRWGGLSAGEARVLGTLMCAITSEGKRVMYKVKA